MLGSNVCAGEQSSESSAGLEHHVTCSLLHQETRLSRPEWRAVDTAWARDNASGRTCPAHAGTTAITALGTEHSYAHK